MSGKPKNPTQRHERCPDCNTEMGAAFVRIKNGDKRKWSNKDIKICTNPHCSTILTHSSRNIYIKQTKVNVAKKFGMNHADQAQMLDVLVR